MKVGARDGGGIGAGASGVGEVEAGARDGGRTSAVARGLVRLRLGCVMVVGSALSRQRMVGLKAGARDGGGIGAVARGLVGLRLGRRGVGEVSGVGRCGAWKNSYLIATATGGCSAVMISLR